VRSITKGGAQGSMGGCGDELRCRNDEVKAPSAAFAAQEYFKHYGL